MELTVYNNFTTYFKQVSMQLQCNQKLLKAEANTTLIIMYVVS
jgi:hypothetical protein